jgi:methylated-DNA-[protein]-cysteine S-methyltransferase
MDGETVMKNSRKKSVFKKEIFEKKLISSGWNYLGDSQTIKKELSQIKKLKIHHDAFASSTEFEQSVWALCSQIPEGAVVTYKEMACALGKPKASRAVANALGKNPLGIKIPCHRVVAGNSIGGYSCDFGIKPKKILLSLEGAF